MTYPEIFGRYRLYLKSLVLVLREAPLSRPVVGAEGTKMFEFKTSILLNKALKTLPSHFKFEQTIVFFFTCSGGQKIQNPTGQVLGYLNMFMRKVHKT